MSYVSVRKSRKYEENVTSKRCGLATFTECVPLPPEARGLNASTAGSHKTYNSWRARSCFEHTKQAKVGGQSAGPKACLALLAERKQQRMLSRRRERLPFPLSRFPVRTFRVLLERFITCALPCQQPAAIPADEVLPRPESDEAEAPAHTSRAAHPRLVLRRR